MTAKHTEEIARSWRENARAWTSAVRGNSIPSRIAGTNAAILEAFGLEARGLKVRSDERPLRVLDVGCGEGWLAHQLAQTGCDVLGFDATDDLIRKACETTGAAFLCLSYEQLCATPALIEGTFDRIVCNYSLFEENIQPLLRVLRTKLASGGRLIIQTLHPSDGRSAEQSAGHAAVSEWRQANFAGMGHVFPAAMPYYLRTLPAWLQELHSAQLRLTGTTEPTHPATGAPLSLILIAQASD